MPEITDPRLLQHLNSGTQQSGLQRIGPANQKLPLELQGAQLGNQRAAQQIQADQQLLPLQVQKAVAELEKTKTETERAKLGRPSPERLAELKDKRTSITNMERSLNELSGLYGKSFAGRPSDRGFGLAEYLPGTLRPENKQFDKLANQMGPYIMSILGLSGKSTDAAAEYKQKVLPFIPDRADPDAATLQTLRNLNRMLNTQKEATFKELGTPYRKVKQRAPWAAKAAPVGDDGWKIEEIK